MKIDVTEMPVEKYQELNKNYKGHIESHENKIYFVIEDEN
jgi:hypothetical protein|tara:strand:+ start:2887 stop:3006 length:120 start_codon:yes stop_codon:yes gene_type:complete